MRVPNIAILSDTKFNKMEVDQSYTSMYVTKDMADGIYEPVETSTFDITVEKEAIKFIKLCEKFIRNSFEYSEYRRYLSIEMDMNKCAFFDGVGTFDDSRRMKIEIHHAPLTLYDITETVISKQSSEGQLNILKIAQEVMELHYRGLVGLIPLSETVHELVHAGKVFIPVHYVYGYPSKFVDEYGVYMSKELKNNLNKNIEASKTFIRTPDILKPKYVYFTDGYSLPRADIFDAPKSRDIERDNDI